MTFDSIVKNLRAAERKAEEQLRKIQAAIHAYQGAGTSTGQRKKSKMSAAARQRISQAMKARWASKRK
jgi:hypothetical protein